MVPSMAVNLGEIPGRLVDLGRPPLAPRLPAQLSQPQPPPAVPKDTSVMEHGVAGDLMLSKKVGAMSRARTRRRTSRHSAGSVRSKKSACNSDLQVYLGVNCHPLTCFCCASLATYQIIPESAAGGDFSVSILLSICCLLCYASAQALACLFSVSSSIVLCRAMLLPASLLCSANIVLQA